MLGVIHSVMQLQVLMQHLLCLPVMGTGPGGTNVNNDTVSAFTKHVEPQTTGHDGDAHIKPMKCKLLCIKLISYKDIFTAQ